MKTDPVMDGDEYSITMRFGRKATIVVWVYAPDGTRHEVVAGTAVEAMAAARALIDSLRRRAA